MSDVSVEPGLADKIIKQVEYYFGDINLSKDKFMQEELQKESGWISLETLVKFNRLKQLSSDFNVIIESLKQSNSQLLEIDEQNKKVRRVKALPENLEEFDSILKQNTVYVKGFPEHLTLDDLYQFFEPFGKVLQVFMRRFPGTKQFKGSVFVTFENNEQLKSLMDKEEFKYEDNVLARESQEDYLKRKGPLLDSIKEARKKKEQEREEKRKQREEAEQAFIKQQKVLGSVLHLKGFNSESTRELIKELFDNYCRVKWIDYNKGEPEAYVRFAEENKAKEALENAIKANENGELILKGAKLEARVLDGEEEEEFWKDVVKKMVESKKNRQNKRGGGRGGRGGRGNNGGGGRRNRNKRAASDDDDDDNDDNENQENGDSSKKLKTDDN